MFSQLQSFGALVGLSIGIFVLHDRTASKRLVIVLLVAGMISGVQAAMPASVQSQEHTPAVNFDALREKFGEPDIDDTSAYDNPRPPMVTRWLVYKKQSVQFFFVPIAPIGAAPPYEAWRLFGITDNNTDAPISADEVLRRFGLQ